MIREYKKGDLSSGFIGHRVSVFVNGKSKQKWLSHSIYEYSKAVELANDLEKKWQKLRLDSIRNAVKSKSNTGVKGLSFGYNVTTKSTGKRYAYPVISYSYRKEGKTKTQAWMINSKTLLLATETWDEICLTIKNTRTLRFNTYQKLLNNKPDSVTYFENNPYQEKSKAS